MSGSNTYNPRITNWDVVWSSYSLGLVNEVQPDIKLITTPVTRGTTGKKVVLDDFVSAVDAKVKVKIPDIAAALIKELCPWIGSGAQYLAPSVPNTLLYQYAALLTLHPHDIAAATTTEDLSFPKAVPFSLFDLKRDGDKESDWEVEFKVYPDFTKLTAGTPILCYAYLGPVPS